MLLAPVQLRISSPAEVVGLPVHVETPTDHELMIAVRAGEIRRLGDLFECYNGRLHGFFVRLTTSRIFKRRSGATLAFTTNNSCTTGWKRNSPNEIEAIGFIFPSRR